MADYREAFGALAGGEPVSGVPEFMSMIQNFLSNRGAALGQTLSDTGRVGSAVGNYLANAPANALDYVGNQVAAPFLQSQYEMMNRDYSQEPLMGVGEGGELTGRIPAVAELVSPYLQGFAPPGTLSAGARAPRSTRSLAGKGVQEANPDVAAPPIGSGSDAPLFNYSLASEEPPPFVPQVPLERMEPPPKGIPAHYQAVASPENIEQMKARIEEGIKRGGLKWFGPGPLYDAWGNVLNDQGPAALRQYMESLGGTTNLSQVPTNARNASYQYWLWRNDQPVPASGADILPGYGHIAQESHLQNMREIREGNFSTAQHPKPPSFTENALGNYTPVTWDQRMGTFGNLRDTKGKVIAGPDQNKYGFLEDIVQRLAREREVPIHPAGAQASGWLTTGRDYENKTFAEILEDVIRQSADKYKLDPRVMRDRFIGAVDPLR